MPIVLLAQLGSGLIIRIANDHFRLIMDLGFVHERDAHAPAREWPDQLQKGLCIEFLVIDIHDEITILVIRNRAFQHMTAR